ncbi:MAG: hypothetical protein IJ501_03220 [Bacilli bacterium]|nr:hypothetical protein [Bacilli bacterium]
MLDDYKENNFYDYAKNLKKYYHAYLFEVDNLEDNYPLILAFAKTIICKNHYTNKNQCDNCNICHLIDENYYEDLKVIEPDGINIKKEQILELQKKLSLKSSNGNNQVYIIKEANKLNPSAGNSLLKFIEEPENGIYGILITTDKNQILKTILSRCNLISLKSLKKEEFEETSLKNLLDFLKLIHQKKENSLPYLKPNFFNNYQTKDDVIKAFNQMEVILDNIINLNFQTNTLNSTFCDIIKTSLKDISNSDLIFYLEKIVKFKNKLITIPNLNLNLFMDRFVIEMSKVR